MTIVKTGADAEAPGRFGRFGGRYVPETLMSAVTELEESYAAARADKPRLWHDLIIFQARTPGGLRRLRWRSG